MLDSILDRHKLQSLGILLTEEYCSELHNREYGDESVDSKSQVLNPMQLRMKYGDQTAMLFCWSGFYLNWLKLPAIIIFVAWLITIIIELDLETDNADETVYRDANFIIFVLGAFMCLYSSLLDALWRRRENETAWKWGTIELNTVEAQRLEFKGKWEDDEVTGHKRKRRETERVFVIKRAFSFFMTAVFILIDVGFMVAVFEFRNSFTNKSRALQYSGSVLMNALEYGMSSLYKFVSKRLNDWENIEFESQYYNSLCVKRFLFEFINQYGPLFYIAYLQYWTQDVCSFHNNCLLQLNEQIITQFFVFFGMKIANLFWLRVRRRIKERRILNQYSKEHRTSREIAYKEIPRTEYKFMLDIEQESTMEDHMDFVLLYGLVLLFSATAPYSAVYMLVTMWIYNALSRKLKMQFTRRPFPHPAQGVGVWDTIMLCISIIAAFTNPALAIFTAWVFNFNYVNHYWVTFVGLSIGLLLCKMLVNLALPKMPKAVEWGLAWGNRMAQIRLNNQDEKNKQNIEATTTMLADYSINE